MATAAELNVVLKLQDRTAGGLKSFGGRIQNLSGKVKLASTAMVAGIAAVGIKSIMMASDTTESLSKVRVVFGESAKSVEAFAETASTALRASRQEVLEAAGTFGNLLVASGQSEDAAAAMSIEIIQLGADLASFNNIDSTVALDKLRSGLIGQSEPLQSLGVNLTASRVKLMGLEMGLVSAGEEMTESQKQSARLAIIMADTTKAHGDASRTAGEFAGSMEGLKATISDVASDMGGVLLPMATDVVGVLLDLVKWFKNLSDPMKDAIVKGVAVAGALAGLALVIGPLIGILGGMTIAVGALATAMAFLAANPIALIVLGLGAAGVAAFKLKEHIDDQATSAREAGEDMVELAGATDMATRAAAASAEQSEKMGNGLADLLEAINRVSEDSRAWALITDAQREALVGLDLQADSSAGAFDDVRRSVIDQIEAFSQARTETDALAVSQQLQAEESVVAAATALELEKQLRATNDETIALRETLQVNMFRGWASAARGYGKGIDAATLASAMGNEEAGFFAEAIDQVAEAARIAKIELDALTAASAAAAAAELGLRETLQVNMFRGWASAARGYADGIDASTMAALMGNEEQGFFAESIDKVTRSSGRARSGLSELEKEAKKLQETLEKQKLLDEAFKIATRQFEEWKPLYKAVISAQKTLNEARKTELSHVQAVNDARQNLADLETNLINLLAPQRAAMRVLQQEKRILDIAELRKDVENESARDRLSRQIQIARLEMEQTRDRAADQINQAKLTVEQNELVLEAQRILRAESIKTKELVLERAQEEMRLMEQMHIQQNQADDNSLSAMKQRIRYAEDLAAWEQRISDIKTETVPSAVAPGVAPGPGGAGGGGGGADPNASLRARARMAMDQRIAAHVAAGWTGERLDIEVRKANASLGSATAAMLNDFLGGTATGVSFGTIARKDLVPFAHGGLVPGPRGAAVPAVLHGGETVIPAGQRAAPTVIVNVQGSVTSERDLVRAIREGLLRQGRGVTTLGLT